MHPNLDMGRLVVNSKGDKVVFRTALLKILLIVVILGMMYLWLIPWLAAGILGEISNITDALP